MVLNSATVQALKYLLIFLVCASVFVGLYAVATGEFHKQQTKCLEVFTERQCDVIMHN